MPRSYRFVSTPKSKRGLADANPLPSSLLNDAHTARGIECRYDGCSHRCDDLYDELKCLSLCHGIKF